MKNTKTICIIDDDDIYLFLSKKTIAKFNPEIRMTTFVNGEEAILSFKKMILANEVLPEIILLDINMPILDGWQFMDEFLKINPPPDKSVSIYITSSSLDPADIERSKRYEAVKGFLHKPLDTETLVRICTLNKNVAQ